MERLFKKTTVQEKALRLLTGPSRYVLLFGGSRSGKTFILVYAILVRALRAAGSRHAILRLHGNSVRQSVLLDTLPKVAKLAFPGLKFKESRQDQFVRLPNHSEIWFAGVDGEERVDKILGKEFATIYFNECSEIGYEAVNTVLTRLAQRTALRNRAYFDCNPAGKSHWSYKLFVEKRDPVSGLALPFPQNYASMQLNPAENRENLPEGYLEETLAGLSERQRMRFLEGRWLDDFAGALWTPEMIERDRVDAPPEEFERIVVGVDPAVSSERDADETGIVTVGRGRDRHFYVLSDASLTGRPTEWAGRVIDEYHRFRADRVAGEVNNGGELIETVLRSVDADGSYREGEKLILWKEEDSSGYEEKIRELEEQMTTFRPESGDSPDRLDALVWAVTMLMEHSGPRHIIS